MSERNVVVKNVAMLDMRNANADRLASIRHIENVALILVREDTDLDGIEISNCASIVRIPDDVRFSMLNGSSELGVSDLEGRIFILANGSFVIAPEVTPEMLREHCSGMLVNGILRCSRSVSNALTGMGAQINGKTESYPDGAILRFDEDFVLDADTAGAVAPGIYAVGSLRALDAASIDVARERGVRFFTDEMVCREELRASAMELLSDCSPDVTLVPRGFEYAGELSDIDRLRARRLRGQVFAQGDVKLNRDVKPQDLKALKALYITGTLSMTEAQFDELADVDMDCASLKLSYPGDIEVDDDYALNAAALEALEGKCRLIVHGNLKLEEDITAQLIQDRISELIVDDDIIAPKALMGVLAAMSEIGGEYRDIAACAELYNAGEPREEGVTYISNTAMYQM
ncbi:MAG: hypothetical protein ACOYIH_04935 [Candidatus Fimadaptatus sp.]|jgi:hypothetical protein